jgi:hypothetical protein
VRCKSGLACKNVNDVGLSVRFGSPLTTSRISAQRLLAPANANTSGSGGPLVALFAADSAHQDAVEGGLVDTAHRAHARQWWTHRSPRKT